MEKDGSSWRFRGDGKLISVLDRNGRTLLLPYNTTTNKVDQIRALGHGSSRALSVTWTGNQVTSVSDGTNAAWNYLYSGSFLSKVCDPRNNNTATGLCTTYINDGYGRIAQVIKPGGNQDVGISYYGDGTVLARRDGQNNQWSFSYNLGTLAATTTDPLERVTTEQYNSLGQIINRTEPGDGNIPTQTTTFTYDTNGYLSKKTNAIGSWQYVNDYRGNQVQVTDPTGATSFYSFSNRDEVIAYRDARSASSTDNTYRWTYGYDANGNRVRETNPYGWSRTWAYQITSNTALPGTLTSETDWVGNTINYGYNGIGDVTSITYPGVAGDNVTYTYDPLGRKASEYGRIAAPGITYTYDSLNAPLTITEPPVTNPLTNVVHRRRITMVYYPNHVKQSELVEDIGGSGAADVSRTTTYTYDANDREISSTDPLGYTTSRTFDNVGNVLTVTDGRGSITQTEYNVRNLASRILAPNYVDPTGQSTVGSSLAVMVYDGAGRLVSQTDGLNRIHTFTYDAMNRMLTRVLTSFTDRNFVSRPITEVQYTYDVLGNKTFERSGNNSLVHAYIYDQAGRLVQDNNQSQPRWDWFTLDRNGNVTSAQRVTTGNVVLSKKDSLFDPRNRPTSVTIDMGGTAPNRTSTYSYTKFGTVATETNPLSAVTTYVYDTLGRLSSATAPTASHEDVGGVSVASGAAMVKGYDTFGNVTHDRDPKGSIVTTTYDKNNRRTRVDQPGCSSGCQSPGAYETWGYDQAGNVLNFRDRRGFVTDYLYDTLNRNVLATLPQVGATPRATQQTQYDPAGNVIRSINEVGTVTSFVYNEQNRVYYVQNGGQKYFDYNDLGQAIWERDARGFPTTHEYLPTGEMTKTVDPVGAVTTMDYDGLGRQVKVTDPMGRVSTTGYTRASELSSSSRLVGGAVYSSQSATYDAVGNLDTTVNPVGTTTKYTYDQMQRMVNVTLSPGVLNISNTYGYDRNSNLTRSTNGNLAVSTFTYNQWNLQTSTIEPSTAAYPSLADRTYTTTFDAGGLTVGETEPGTSVSRSFDPLAHPVAASWTGAGQLSVQKNYVTDARGRLTAANDGNNYSSFSYNNRDLLASAQQWEGSELRNYHYATYTYDLNGNMISRNQSRPGGGQTSLGFAYNSRSQVESISDSNAQIVYRVYNLAGQRTTDYLFNATREYQYDGVGRFQGHSYNSYGPSGFGPLTSTTYGYYPDDNVQTKNVNYTGNASSGTNTYTYDATDRLKTWAGPQGSITYGYDKAGNRISAGAQSFVYDPRNRLTTGSGLTFSWAARGTPTSQVVGGVVSTFTVDAADRTRSVVTGGTTVSYGLDVLDRVNSRSVNGGSPSKFNFAGFDSDPSGSFDPVAGVTNEYFRMPSGELYEQVSSTPQGGIESWVGLDLHGDATEWASSSSVYVTKQYDPFGKLTNMSGANFLTRSVRYLGR